MDSIRHIKAWHKSLFKNRLSRNIAFSITSTATAQGVLILISPILTRLYTPTDLGMLAVYNATLTVLSVLTSLRYELTIPLPEDEDTAANLLALSVLLLPITAIMVGAVVMMLQAFISWEDVQTGTLLYWLVPGLIVVGAYQALNYWFLRKRSFSPIATSKALQSVFQAGGHIILGILIGGTLGLLIGLLLGYMVGALWFAFLIWTQDRHILRTIRLQKMWSGAKKYKNFPLISSGSALINNIGIQLPVYIITLFFDTGVVGLFALTQRVINVPISVLSGSIGQVFTSEAAYFATNSPSELMKLFNQMTQRLFLVALLPALIFALVGPWLFEFVFGAEWREAGVYASLLMPLIIARFVVSPAGQVFNVLELLNFQLIWDVVRLVVLVVALVLVAQTENARLTIATYSIVLTLLYGGLYLIYRRVIFNLEAKRA